MPNPNRDPKTGRYTTKPWFLAAGATVVVGAASIGGTGAVGGSGAATESAIGQSVRANVSKSRGAAQKGRRDEAWRGMGARRLKEVVKRATNCAVNSYGDVQQFFVRTPCRSLDRMVFALDDGQGGSIVVAVSWVKMRTAGKATELRALVDRDGTGNVSPLLDAGGVKFTGRYYDSRGSTDLVVIAEAEPLAGRPDPALMDGLAEVAVQFPPP